MREPKKLFHVEMALDAAALHDVMSAADGRAFNLKVSAVKMAGQEPATTLNQVSTGQMVEEFVAKHKGDQFNIGADVIPAIRARGGSASATYPAIAAMLKRGGLIKVSPGTYRIVGRQGLLPPPAKSNTEKFMNAKPVKKAKRSKLGKPSNRDIITEAISEGPKTSAQLSAIFKKKNRNPKSISPVLTKMRDENIIAKNGGAYQLLNGAA